VGALVLGALSYFEHSRCVQTSFLLNVYLLFTVIFDTARSRSYSLDEQLNQISILFTTRVGVKVFLAGFEARGKGSLLLSGYTGDPPEATAGVYNRSLFWWQHALLKKGFNSTLSIDDLYQLDRYLHADYLNEIMRSAWDKGKLRL
jgi:ATP-binding cassette subfamily C (CFTR/MRP) protein 1